MRQSVFPVLHGASCVLIVWRNIVTGIVIRETSLSLVWRQGVLHQTSHGQHSFFSKCKWCGPYLIELCSFSKLIFLLKDHSDQPQTKFWFLRKHRGVQKIPGHRSSAQKKRLQRRTVGSGFLLTVQGCALSGWVASEGPRVAKLPCISWAVAWARLASRCVWVAVEGEILLQGTLGDF